MKKLSKIALEMALTLLKKPRKAPSSETAHTALLFVHVAWNKSLGNNDALNKYKDILPMFEKENPNLWNEFKNTNHIDIINSLVDYKQRYYPADDRNITVCGMRKGNVHVEWAED